METQNNSNIKTSEINDGREDIYLAIPHPEEGKEPIKWMFISQDLYKGLGYTYEQMKDPVGMAKCLMSYSLALMYDAGERDIVDLPRLLDHYKKLAECVQYFIDRVEGVHPTDGQISSRKTYKMFKEVMDGIKVSATPNNGQNPERSNGLS